MKGKRFSIHVRVLGLGLVVWIVGLTTSILAIRISSWFGLLLLLLPVAVWAIVRDDKP